MEYRPGLPHPCCWIEAIDTVAALQTQPPTLRTAVLFRLLQTQTAGSPPQ